MSQTSSSSSSSSSYSSSDSSSGLSEYSGSENDEEYDSDPAEFYPNTGSEEEPEGDPYDAARAAELNRQDAEACPPRKKRRY